jgi:hypothetical protein
VTLPVVWIPEANEDVLEAEVQAFLALNIGLSAPRILKALASGMKTIKID